MHVFVDLHLVGHVGQRIELHAKFVLGRCHLVVMLLDLHAHAAHGAKHLRAHVLDRILRWNREVAALGADAVAEIAALIFAYRNWSAIRLNRA